MIRPDYDGYHRMAMRNNRPIALWLLSRSPFALIVISALLGWEGLKRYRLLEPAIDWRIILYFVAAVLSLVMAFVGFRERYRNQDDQNLR